MTIPNSDKVDGLAFDVLMEGSDGKVAEEKITGMKKWFQTNVPPGQHKVSISAMVMAILVKLKRSQDPRPRCPYE